MVNRKHVLKTLLYFDIFNYPLKKDEIWEFLEVKSEKNIFFRDLDKYKIPNYKSFYYLKAKTSVDQRLLRQKINEQKLAKAFKLIHKLSFIPTVKFIGISGSLAMGNSKRDDDIDLFVITSSNLIWFTRLISVLILICFGVYRNSKDRMVSNKICLNYLISENALGFNKSSHNLYLAHEIGQMFPVLNVDNTYEKFINQNKWIYTFLPNISHRINNYKIRYKKTRGVLWEKANQILLIIKIETLARFIQWQYMKRKITKETVSNNVLAFHPVDYKIKILEKYFKEINGIK